MKPVAIQYICRNPGQTALLWAWQPAPFGHGWIDVKQEPLVRLSDVEALRKDAERYRWLMNTCTEVDVQTGICWLGGEEGIDKHIREGTTK